MTNTTKLETCHTAPGSLRSSKVIGTGDLAIQIRNDYTGRTVRHHCVLTLVDGSAHAVLFTGSLRKVREFTAGLGL